MSEYVEITYENKGRFIDYITILRRCPCDQCRKEAEKASDHLREYSEKP
jgi:hypothetical protein